jgi:hypothetical protein
MNPIFDPVSPLGGLQKEFLLIGLQRAKCFSQNFSEWA